MSEKHEREFSSDPPLCLTSPPNDRNDKLPFISRKKDVGHVGQQDTP